MDEDKERFSEPEISPQELLDADDPELDNEQTQAEVEKRMHFVRLKLINYFGSLGVFKKIERAMDQISEQTKHLGKDAVAERMNLCSRHIRFLVKSLNRKAKRITKLRVKRDREKREKNESPKE